MDFGMIGPGIVLGFGCLGSAIGCAIASMATHGVMARVDEGHAKFIGMALMPSTQAIYGIVLMINMRAKVVAGALSPLSALGVGLAVGTAILISAVYQGISGATAIQATAKQPSIFGKCVATLGVIESFALFAFVFTLISF